MTSERLDDANLVAGVIEGDEGSLESIDRMCGGAIKLVARKLVKGDAFAEDVGIREADVISPAGDIVSMTSDV